MLRAPAALAVLVLAPAARADSLRLSLEGGAEYDSNIHRIELREGEAAEVQAAPLLRLGARLRGDTAPRAGHRATIDLFAGGKRFFGDDTDDKGRAPGDENVAMVSGSARYDIGLPERRAVVRFAGSLYDAFGDESAGGSRNFQSADGRAAVVLAGPGDHRVTAHAGLRRFRYKPNDLFDWTADHYGLRYAANLWSGDSEGEADASAVGVTFDYRIERRDYASAVLTDACDPPCPDPAIGRVDLFHAASAEASYTGDRVYSLRYELQVVDSNSYGQSLVRHRVEAGVTAEVPLSVFVTAKATLQYNVFQDGLLLTPDVAAQTGISIDDENRNGLVVHAARELGAAWSAEARYGLFSNEFATEELRFRRQTGYLGLLYEYR
jgi:hypothetical protein